MEATTNSPRNGGLIRQRIVPRKWRLQRIVHEWRLQTNSPKWRHTTNGVSRCGSPAFEATDKSVQSRKASAGAMQQNLTRHLCENRSLWKNECQTLAQLCGFGASVHDDKLADVCADDELMEDEGNNTLLQICERDIHSLRASLYPTIIPVFTVVTLISGVVSSLVVAATPWVRRPMSPTIRLSLSLAAANTVVSLALILDLFINTYVPTVYPLLRCSSVYGHYVCIQLTIFTVKMAMILVQVLHLLVVAMNHYIGIRRPLHYATIVTPRFLKKVLAGLWVSPLAGMFAAFSAVPGQGYQSPSCANNEFIETGITFRIVWICIFFGPTLLIILAYCHIFFLLKNRSLYLVSAEQRSQLRRNINHEMANALNFLMLEVRSKVKAQAHIPFLVLARATRLPGRERRPPHVLGQTLGG
ncbi:Trace amine-associated receptor 2 [Penaeus vannamei]|uniref:Trace amine-associated receptor 2 n=1 Tax=Penaeus vannamei TaxID=6689 RepID=A0A423TLJ0_PENVA|nr:Trace amine-associated receptor 2 [Penaeus vannamei]